MNITEVKESLGIARLNLVRSIGVDEKPTEWYSHWEDPSRTSVCIHEDLVKEIAKHGDNLVSLGTKETHRNGTKGKFRQVIVVKYSQEPEYTF